MITGRPKTSWACGVRGVRGAEAGAGQQHVAGQQDVALALVGVLRRRTPRSRLARTRPRTPGASSARSGVAELHGQHLAVDHGGAVGGEDHVGQAGQRLDQLDGVAEVEVRLPQGLPLADGQRVVVRRRRVHPRVDPVGDGEVGRPAHQVAARRGGGRHDRNAMREVPAYAPEQPCARRSIVA